MMAAAKKTRIREIRKQRKLSGHKVAEMLGVTPGAYYKYERGEQSLNEEVLQRLSGIFEVSVDYILGLTDDPGGHFQKEDVNVKEIFESGQGQYHWDGIPLGEKELKAAKEVMEYVLWKKIRGRDN